MPEPRARRLEPVLDYNGKPVMRDKRNKRDLHALDENGMVLCNPRDREAAHRAEVEGIATDNPAAATCRKCLRLLRSSGKRPLRELV